MMKFVALLFFLCLTALLASCAEKPAEFSARSYPAAVPAAAKESAATVQELKLAAGDVVTIEVWGHEDMTRQATLDASGAIRYPLIGKVDALGMTMEQLQAVLREKLSFYYVEPQVTVMGHDLAGQCYYVLGNVANPGKFVMKARTTVLEAAAAAGGPTKSAGSVGVLLRKELEKLKIFSIPLEFEHPSEKDAASSALALQANDILFLPPSSISDAEAFMRSVDAVLSPLLNVERGVMYWPVFKQAMEGTSSEILVQ